jgi:hypothetical protein
VITLRSIASALRYSLSLHVSRRIESDRLMAVEGVRRAEAEEDREQVRLNEIAAQIVRWQKNHS